MKYISDLSEQGKSFVMEQLTKRMKKEYDLNEQGCFDDVMHKVTEDSDWLHYELSRCETESGITEVIDFEDHHFIWDDIEY
ncbi:MAG: hypothetical protein GY928_20900 [Colwellia sp.]|nr:hypothetical protein [Colwellia sp.]